MKADDYYSFKNTGAVPFKWEIRPGVPKIQNPQPTLPDHHQHDQSPRKFHNNHPCPDTQPKLKPPPARFHFQPKSEPRTNSFLSSPRSKRFGIPGIARPDVVTSSGCLPSHLVKVKHEKRTRGNPPELEYCSDIEIQSGWSVSSRRSVSPLSSSFASYQSSPRPVSDAEWAAFGLF